MEIIKYIQFAQKSAEICDPMNLSVFVHLASLYFGFKNPQLYTALLNGTKYEFESTIALDILIKADIIPNLSPCQLYEYFEHISVSVNQLDSNSLSLSDNLQTCCATDLCYNRKKCISHLYMSWQEVLQYLKTTRQDSIIEQVSLLYAAFAQYTSQVQLIIAYQQIHDLHSQTDSSSQIYPMR